MNLVVCYKTGSRIGFGFCDPRGQWWSVVPGELMKRMPAPQWHSKQSDNT